MASWTGGGSGAAEDVGASRNDDIDVMDEVTDGSGRQMAGFSFSRREAAVGALHEDTAHVWRKGDDSFFRVRTGPNYKK